jgi:hypothetical protein
VNDAITVLSLVVLVAMVVFILRRMDGTRR